MLKQYHMYTYNAGLVPRPQGLNNCGAVCWLNSLLQFMAGLPALTHALIMHGNRANPLVAVYLDWVTNPHPDPAPKVLRAMQQRANAKKITLTLSFRQECADEAFTKFLELLECPEAEYVFRNVYVSQITCTLCDKVTETPPDRGYRIELFTLSDLTEDTFIRHLRVRDEPCDYFECECGAKMTNFHKIDRLRMLREVVVIIFNKFQSKERRYFPRELEFPSNGGSTLKYALVGKIEHSGTADGGHYVAHSRRGDGWICANDTFIGPGSPDPTPDTFMIAYHLVE